MVSALHRGGAGMILPPRILTIAQLKAWEWSEEKEKLVNGTTFIFPLLSV